MNNYFCWLVGLIGDNYIGTNYQKLLWKLFTKEFIWELDYDRNRAADGLYLRRNFCREAGINESQILSFGVRDNCCTMLEMMVALARRAEHELMYNPDYGDRSGLWFWTMLQNLGLDIYDDYNWYEIEVDKILENFLHHRYEKNGTGGAFPVKYASRDFRKMDLWWQINAYFGESYTV